MGFNSRRRLYENLPEMLRALVLWVPFSVVAGKSYRDTLRRNAALDFASRTDILRYQESSLKRMLTFACEQVPAYHRLRSTVERLPALEALRAFPLLDKEKLQQHVHNYLPRDFERIPHYECSTGGTSGNQLKFFVDDNSQYVEIGFMHRQWARVGYTPRCRKATFRGVEFPHLRDSVYWQANPIYNELQFSPYHMNEQTLGQYLDQLLWYQPHYLHGYPSSISILADYVVRHDISMKQLALQGVLLGSEALYPGQREQIERAFSTRVFSWYGHSERVLLGGECERTTAYHHFPDYGILELVNDSGEVIEREGETGELVGTGLLNRSLPLIRYRTGDKARKLVSYCTCGRSFDRFDQVEGRWKQEYLIGTNGSRISTAALNVHGPFFKHVVRYQYYQNTPGLMQLRLMVAAGFTEEDLRALQQAFGRKTGPELMVEISIVPEIPLTSRGKLIRLVQALGQPIREGSA
jgi:phenylacetate-CoA ligase